MAATITCSRLLLPTIQNGHNTLKNIGLRCVLDAERYASSSSTVTKTLAEDLPKNRRFDFDAESLAARGYLRNQKPYTPPKDVETKVLQICKKYLRSNTTFTDSATKYSVLVQCSQSLQHSLPNSLIHKITNIDELVAFYKSPVNTTVPLDMMKDIDLPKNLHVIYKYNRFHPETDTMFGGITAFTKDSTLVTGLKYKKKYPSYIVENKWPYDLEKKMKR